MARVMKHNARFTQMLLFALASLLAAAPTRAQVSKADRLFMKHGLYIHALVFPEDLMHLKTLQDCGFTGVTWPGKSNMKELGPPPGIPWATWLVKDDQPPISAEEQPYASNLIALQFHDEQNLNDEKTLAIAKKWFDEMRRASPT